MRLLKQYLPCLALTLLVGIVGEPCRAAEPDADAKTVRSFLDAHCVRCHGKEDPEGKVSLHVVSLDAKAPQDIETWKRVYEQLFNGQMPPQGKPKPTPEEAERFTLAVRNLFERHDRTAPRDPGLVTMRRLNRVEYVNTIRDLLSASRTMLMAPLLSPEALHRFEVGRGAEVSEGRHRSPSPHGMHLDRKLARCPGKP